MKNFSVQDLKAKHAILSETLSDISIEILMHPFIADNQIVDTSIRLNHLDLPSNILGDLAGKSFEFPTNPDDGYIDGSIYLNDVHHPVDVSSLAFNISRHHELTLVIRGNYIFEFESLNDLKNTPFVFAVKISSSVFK